MYALKLTENKKKREKKIYSSYFITDLSKLNKNYNFITVQ